MFSLIGVAGVLVVGVVLDRVFHKQIDTAKDKIVNFFKEKEDK